MKLWTYPLGPFQANTYVLSTEEGEGIVIDPGMDPQPLLEYIDSLRIKAILLTHAHLDHIGGLEQVRQLTKAPVYIHDLEADWLFDPVMNGSANLPFLGGPIRCQPRDEGFKDGEILQLAGLSIQVIHTPGHSPGSVSFYLKDEGILISGDALFAGSIGRTDLPGGDYPTLIRSIKEKLLVLPPETKVFPGHGPETTIGDEKRYNPFVGEG